MANYEISAPDGTKYQITAPDNASQDQVLAYAQQQHVASAQPQSVGQQIGDYVRGIYNHGINTVPQSIMELGARGLDATGVTDNAYNTLHNEFKTDDQQFGGTSKFYKGGAVGGDILGSLPATALRAPAAVAALPRIGGALAPIVSGALQGATAAGLTSSSSDAPLGKQLAIGTAGGALLPTLGVAAKSIGGDALPALLGVTTGTGATPIKTAFNAGLAGGDQAQAFTDAMRGATPLQQVVADAKGALSNMRAQRGAEYRSGMQDISKDASVLSFDPLDAAMAKGGDIKTFKGQDLSPKTADVRTEIQGAIDNWKGLDPAEYHTPEGFDALKQQIGDVRDSLPFNTPQRVVADQAYNAVRKTIADQAPTYAKVMQDYSTASDEISQIERELSLKPGANPQTTLKKLQSIMRNDVNTNWGGRADLGNRLANAGATTLLPQLAGQSMSAMAPRGLGRVVAGGEIAAPLMAGSAIPLMKALPVLAASSPRLVGEAAYGIGAAQRGATNLGARVPLNLPNLLPLLNTGFGVGLPAAFAQS